MSETQLPGSASSRRLRRLAGVTGELLVAESREAVAKVVTEHLTDAAEASIGSLSLVLDEETLELVRARFGAHVDVAHLAYLASTFVSEGARHWAAGAFGERSFADVVTHDITTLIDGYTHRRTTP